MIPLSLCTLDLVHFHFIVSCIQPLSFAMQTMSQFIHVLIINGIIHSFPWRAVFFERIQHLEHIQLQLFHPHTHTNSLTYWTLCKYITLSVGHSMSNQHKKFLPSLIWTKIGSYTLSVETLTIGTPQKVGPVYLPRYKLSVWKLFQSHFYLWRAMFEFADTYIFR